MFKLFFYQEDLCRLNFLYQYSISWSFPRFFFYSKEPERKVEVAPEEEDNNPFAEDADETPSPSQEDSPRQMNGKEGVPVRALYDYTVTEEDELPLKAGEFLHKGDGCWD